MQIAPAIEPAEQAAPEAERPPAGVRGQPLPAAAVATGSRGSAGRMRACATAGGYRFVEIRSPAEWLHLTGAHSNDSIFLSWGWGEYKSSIGWRTSRVRIETAGGETVGACSIAVRQRFGVRLCHVQGGPLLFREDSDEHVARILTDLGAHLKLGPLDVIAVSPYAFGSKALVLGLLSAGYLPMVNRSHFTLMLDLTRGLDPIRDGLGGRWRRSLKDAERHLTVRFPVSRACRDEALARLAPMYAALSKRKGFRGSAVIERMGPAVIDDPRFVMLEVLDGQTVVASRIAHVSGDLMTDFIAATTEQGLEHHAGYFAAWSLIEKAVSMRLQRLDCGGIDPFVSPGVFQFKRGVSKDVRQSEPIWLWSRSKLVRNGIQLWSVWG